MPENNSNEALLPTPRRSVLIGFKPEEEWFDYRLEHDPCFLRRADQARESLRAGRGIRLEELEPE